MALVVTLEQLRSDALLWADARPGGVSEFVGTNDLDRLISLHCGQWYDLLLAQRPQDQPTPSTSLVATPGTATLAFPTNLVVYAIVTCEILWDGTTPANSTRVEPVPAIALADAHKYANVTWGEGCPKGYTRGESNDNDLITIYPTPRTAARFFFRYLPGFTPLVPSPGPGHLLVTYNHWDKLITLGVAIEILAIQGRNSGHLQKLFDDQLARLQALAAERIATTPKTVRDVQPEGRVLTDRWPWRLPPP